MGHFIPLPRPEPKLEAVSTCTHTETVHVPPFGTEESPGEVPGYQPLRLRLEIRTQEPIDWSYDRSYSYLSLGGS